MISKNSKIEVSISIVNYYQKELLERCLSTIESLKLPITWQIIIVDNNSLDGSSDMVAEKFPWVRLISLKKNISYAGGHNTSFAQTDSPIFIILNPDVIVQPGSLEMLIQVLEKNTNAAIVGPCLLNPDGSCQFSARRFYTWQTVICRRLPIPGRTKINNDHLMKNCNLNKMQTVDWVLGAAMCIRRSAIKTETLFDTRYKLYFEDVDLCYFIQKEGWDVVYCPQSKMIHNHQRDSAKRVFSSPALKHFVSWIKFYRKISKYHKANQKAIKPYWNTDISKYIE
jgi:N-acetylglucosaminyl-diphospho-decaprenol L-rhamnosyltransferase